MASFSMDGLSGSPAEALAANQTFAFCSNQSSVYNGPLNFFAELYFDNPPAAGHPDGSMTLTATPSGSAINYNLKVSPRIVSTGLPSLPSVAPHAVLRVKDTPSFKAVVAFLTRGAGHIDRDTLCGPDGGLAALLQHMQAGDIEVVVGTVQGTMSGTVQPGP
jgi:hypothetical protein